MLGTRGCRLAVLEPEIYRVQGEAIMRAAVAVRERPAKHPGSRSWCRWWPTSASWSWCAS